MGSPGASYPTSACRGQRLLQCTGSFPGRTGDLLEHIKNIRNYENCWRGFDVAISYNNKDWKRHSTRLVGNRLSWVLKTSKNIVWFAYYVPYPFSRTEKLFKGSEIIGYTLKRNPIYMKTYGSGDKYIWLIARQHPGETIGSWILEGFMKNMKN